MRGIERQSDRFAYAPAVEAKTHLATDQSQWQAGKMTVDRIVGIGGAPYWPDFEAMHPDFVAGARARWAEVGTDHLDVIGSVTAGSVMPTDDEVAAMGLTSRPSIQAGMLNTRGGHRSFDRAASAKTAGGDYEVDGAVKDILDYRRDDIADKQDVYYYVGDEFGHLREDQQDQVALKIIDQLGL